jgi:CHAT domain-containing protein
MTSGGQPVSLATIQRELVGAFFRAIATAKKNGKPVDYAQALREAKLKLRRNKNRRQWAAPYFWAPFIITGK